nr:condensin-2 complex subunit H2 [Ipomoea batatas]
MNVDAQEQPGSSSDASGKIHTLQPLRDLESNWAVDLAKNLESYLLKICSGEISGNDGAHQISVNFSEAALLLQGSVQVYSRKVEYLYSLVLHALQFISQKSEQDQQANASAPTEDGASDTPNDPFWGLDDIPVEAKSLLDNTTSKDGLLNCFVKAPANLVVLEGDCLDTTGDAGELESYLLATSNLYRDFILLDSCDVVAVDDFLNNNKTGKGLNSSCKVRKTGQHSARYSGGVGKQSSARKGQDANLNQSPRLNNNFSANDHNVGYCPSPCHTPENNDDMYEMGGGYSDPRDCDESDDDDPWKPLNPHEPGNLKVKPYRRVKPKRRQGMDSRKHIPITTEFPLARLHGTINSHLYDVWEKCCATKKMDESQSLPLYEKLRQSLFHGENNDHDAFDNHENNEDDDYDNGNHDFEAPDFDMPETAEHNEDEHLGKEKHGNDSIPFDHEGHEDPYTHSTLEDLCRSHLDSLLANLAETEHQTELAARVSTWKQRIEHNLNEQESHPPFDIHEYGEKVLSKLSLEENSGSGVSFSDIVAGQEKHDVARTFSALLQLVNNGDVDLQRDGSRESNGYTAVNPFYIRRLRHEDTRNGVPLQVPSENKAKSPIPKKHPRGEKNKRGKENHPGCSSPPGSNSSCRFTVKLGKGGSRCTPDGKKRRKSRLLEPVNLHTAL